MAKWNKSQAELKRLYTEGKTTVYAYKTVWQVYYSQAQGQYYTQVIQRLARPATLRGRIHATNDLV